MIQMSPATFVGICWLLSNRVLVAAQDFSCNREARSREFMASVPCDLARNSFCETSGESYPWKKLRKFVFENQATIKRMYGYEKHSSVLKEEFDNLFYAEDDLVHPIQHEFALDDEKKIDSPSVKSQAKFRYSASTNAESQRTDRSRKRFSEERSFVFEEGPKQTLPVKGFLQKYYLKFENKLHTSSPEKILSQKLIRGNDDNSRVTIPIIKIPEKGIFRFEQLNTSSTSNQTIHKDEKVSTTDAAEFNEDSLESTTKITLTPVEKDDFVWGLANDDDYVNIDRETTQVPTDMISDSPFNSQIAEDEDLDSSKVTTLDTPNTVYTTTEQPPVFDTESNGSTNEYTTLPAVDVSKIIESSADMNSTTTPNTSTIATSTTTSTSTTSATSTTTTTVSPASDANLSPEGVVSNLSSSVAQKKEIEKEYHILSVDLEEKEITKQPTKRNRLKVRGQSRQPNRTNDRFAYLFKEDLPNPKPFDAGHEKSTNSSQKNTHETITMQTIFDRSPPPAPAPPSRQSFVTYLKPYSDGFNACPVETGITTPYWANNTRGEPRAILNLPPFDQFIHWEKCRFEYSQADCRTGCRCEQQYRLHRMLAFDPYQDCRGVFSDWFKFPSGCVCKCYSKKVRKKYSRKLDSQFPEDSEDEIDDQSPIEGGGFVNEDVRGRVVEESEYYGPSDPQSIQSQDSGSDPVNGNDSGPEPGKTVDNRATYENSDLTDIFFESEDQLLHIKEGNDGDGNSQNPTSVAETSPGQADDDAIPDKLSRRMLYVGNDFKDNPESRQARSNDQNDREFAKPDLKKQEQVSDGKLEKPSYTSVNNNFTPATKFTSHSDFLKAAKKRLLTTPYKKLKYSVSALLRKRPLLRSILRKKNYFISE